MLVKSENTKVELRQDAALLCRMDLLKSWRTKPYYWLELFCQETEQIHLTYPSSSEYIIKLNWSFTNKISKISGSKIHKAEYNIAGAARKIARVVVPKLDKNTIYTFSIELYEPIKTAISDAILDLLKLQEKPHEDHELHENPVRLFMESQRERQLKSEW